MGTITCTCGHSVNNFDETKDIYVATKYNDFEQEKIGNSISYVAVCLDCYKYWKGHTLDTEQEQMDWMTEKIEVDEKYIW